MINASHSLSQILQRLVATYFCDKLLIISVSMDSLFNKLLSCVELDDLQRKSRNPDYCVSVCAWMKKRLFIQAGFQPVTNGHTDAGGDFFFLPSLHKRSLKRVALSHAHTCKHTHLVVVLAGHDIGEGDLGFEHLAAVHELHQQVAHSLELHPLCRLDVG